MLELTIDPREIDEKIYNILYSLHLYGHKDGAFFSSKQKLFSFGGLTRCIAVIETNHFMAYIEKLGHTRKISLKMYSLSGIDPTFKDNSLFLKELGFPNYIVDQAEEI